MFKKYCGVILLLIALGLPSFSSSTIYAQDTTTTPEGNLYVAQENYTLATAVNGDAVLVGGDVSVNANVSGNLIIAGGNVVVNGNIEGDILALAGGVIINGNVNGDIRVIGGTVYINSAIVGGDLASVGGSVSLKSSAQVNGETLVRSANFITNATNNPDDIDELRNITGVYYGLRDDNLSELVKLGAALSVISVILTILYFFGNYIAQLFVIKVFPVLSQQSMDMMRSEWLKSFLIGLLVLLASPFIALILLISGVGNPLLMVLIALFLVVWFFAMAYPSYLAGEYLLRLMNRDNDSDWLKLLIGYIAFYLLFLLLNVIPVIGWGIASLISLIITSWSVGGMLLQKWNKMQWRGQEVNSK